MVGHQGDRALLQRSLRCMVFNPHALDRIQKAYPLERIQTLSIGRIFVQLAFLRPGDVRVLRTNVPSGSHAIQGVLTWVDGGVADWTEGWQTGRWGGRLEGGVADWKVGWQTGRWGGRLEGGAADWKVGRCGATMHHPTLRWVHRCASTHLLHARSTSGRL
eukprot:354799-Chlamydomonas_euryale.AAC.7